MKYRQIFVLIFLANLLTTGLWAQNPPAKSDTSISNKVIPVPQLVVQHDTAANKTLPSKKDKPTNSEAKKANEKFNWIELGKLIVAFFTLVFGGGWWFRRLKRIYAVKLVEQEAQYSDKINKARMAHELALDKAKNEEKLKFEERLAKIRNEERLIFEQRLSQFQSEMRSKEKDTGILQDLQNKIKITEDAAAEQTYRNILNDELGTIKLLGSPEIERLPVHLMDSFVSLNLTSSWRTDDRQHAGMDDIRDHEHRELSPEVTIHRAFETDRMLLIIGDPGSGKTTLMKYYAMCCLSDDVEKFGLQPPVFPLFFPLRELEPKDVEPAALAINLSRRHDSIDVTVFDKWLRTRPTLVLLDGLDEVSDIKQRKRVCEWITKTAGELPLAKFVVTSRWTGYRKLDGIEIEFDHLRADVRDFSPAQQNDFLNKWFQAVYLREINSDKKLDDETWQKQQRQKGLKRAQAVMKFLEKEENKKVRDLAKVPLLLQIIAIICKEREYLPHSRSELYRSALNYLLDFRDRHKKLNPLLPAGKALPVLMPVALWMQGEEIHSDSVPKTDMHDKMREPLKYLNVVPEKFCENLRDRAGILADYGDNQYIFRHKSFREYLAAQQLLKDCHKDEKTMDNLLNHLGDDWWEEPLRFLMNDADADLFDTFFNKLFASKTSGNLSREQFDTLTLMIDEAPQKKIDSLRKHLFENEISEIKCQYILDCLDQIKTKEALKTLIEFGLNQVDQEIEKRYQEMTKRKIALDYVKSSVLFDELPNKNEILAVREELVIATAEGEWLPEKPLSVLNEIEYNAEYILIPGGSYIYQKGGKLEQKIDNLPAFYLAKYPVTNQRYRKFIRYLTGEEADLQATLPKDAFARLLLKFAKSGLADDPEYAEFLGSPDGSGWADKLRSGYDTEKRFNGEEQPVVEIAWYAARAYCFWLSCFEIADESKDKVDLEKAAGLYRLPNEVEWEWAAGGGVRIYPWGDKSKELEKLANYGENEGATTPVGRYPDGATPEGLMDMAGNVWEWQENRSPTRESARSLRGGSWDRYGGNLRCSVRNVINPDNDWLNTGFRVLRSES